MNESVAAQIAELINQQNQLTQSYNTEKVLKHVDRYIVKLGDDGKVIGCVEVKRLQWYQCEIDHLSVRPDAQRKGLGKSLLAESEAMARQLGASITQCTIRVGNIASESLFKNNGYAATITFTNQQSGNRVSVYQKSI